MTIQPNSILRLDTRDPGFPERFRSLVAYEDTADPAVLATVREVIAAIRRAAMRRSVNTPGVSTATRSLPPPRWSCRASGSRRP